MSIGWILLLAACDNALRSGSPPVPDSLPATTAEPLAALPGAEGAVSVLGLAGRPLRLDGFAAQTGCQVTTQTTRTSYSLWSAVHDGGVDLVLATADISRRLIRDDVLQPINPDLVPELGLVPERLGAAPFNLLGGAVFGVPLQWGPQGLLTSDEAFPVPPGTWRVLYEPRTLPDGTSSVGRIQAYEGPISLAETALTVKAHEPEHGIDDPFALTVPQFRTTVRAVRRQRAVVGRYWQDPDQQVADFLAGRVVAASSWVSQARALAAAGMPVTFAIPEEGATAWAITAMIPRDAAHPGCAYRLAAHLLSEEGQTATSEAWASVPARPDVCGPDQCEPLGAGRADTLHLWRSPDRRCGLDEDCAAWHEWIGQHTLARGGL